MTDVWISSTFLAVKHKAAVTFVYKSLCGHVFWEFSLILSRYPRVELLGHIVNLFLTFQKSARLLSKLTAPSVKAGALLFAFKNALSYLCLNNIPHQYTIIYIGNMSLITLVFGDNVEYSYTFFSTHKEEDE